MGNKGAWLGVAVGIGLNLLGIAAGLILFSWAAPRWWSYLFLLFAVGEGVLLLSTLISIVANLRQKDVPSADEDYHKY